MSKTSYFSLSPEEREVRKQGRLELCREKLKHCASQILQEDFTNQAEILAELVNSSLRAYMYLDTHDRPEDESLIMSHLAVQQIVIKREIREVYS